jgi:hypothetical protein
MHKHKLNIGYYTKSEADLSGSSAISWGIHVWYPEGKNSIFGMKIL